MSAERANVRRFARGPTLGLVLGLAACARTPRVSLVPPGHPYAWTAYEQVFDRWTRESEVLTFDGLENRLDVAATFLSADFREAFVGRYAASATLDDADRTQLRNESLATAAREHEFYVALATERTRWANLAANTSAWRVALVDDAGHETAPARIERVRVLTAADRTYYRYTSPWRTNFRVHFPRFAYRRDGREYEVLGAGTRWFILRFSGPLGTADLRWDVSDGAAPAATPATSGPATHGT